MQSKFDELVAGLYCSPLSTDLLDEITNLLRKQTDDTLPSFVAESLSSLQILERWIWELFSPVSHTWIHDSSYQQLLYNLALFNKNVIFSIGPIDTETKQSLLFVVTVEQVSNIFQLINSTTDDNNIFITFIALWIDNFSYFVFDNPQYNSLIVDYIGNYIVEKYVMNEQYRFYLTQLRQPYLPQSIFTTKLRFYIRTCSLYCSSYVVRKLNNLSYTIDEITERLHADYTEIIRVHSLTVASWNKELLSCIAQLIGLAASTVWLDTENNTHLKIILPTEKSACDHIEDLMRIISYEPFYKQTKPTRSNDLTILMGGISILLIILVQKRDIDWFFRSNTAIRDTLVCMVENINHEQVAIYGYCVLVEVLTEEQLKDLKIADNICDYFIKMIDDAWKQPTKKYKHIPIVFLLRGLQSLSRNDSIQQKMANSNKVYLFLEMCDEYSIVYDIIWAFSFNHDIHQQLRSHSSFIDKLIKMSTLSEDGKLQKTIDGILWNLQTNHDNRPNSETKKFDIMISYSHKEKVLCKQIYDELTKAGYRIWIDFDQMHGNVMDAMAQAIEQSTTVIICMSEQYRKSNYCRAEAQYAFQRERKIVPLLLQKHYKPDGWLLFLIGQLLYVDFNKYEFPRAMEMLFKELKTGDKSQNQSELGRSKEDISMENHTASVSSPTQIIVSMGSSSNILEWTKSQVHDWLLEQNLIQMSRLLKDCNGRSLIYLCKYMKHCSSQQILTMLGDDTRRRLNENISLVELCCFLSLMDEQRQLLQCTNAGGNNRND